MELDLLNYQWDQVDLSTNSSDPCGLEMLSNEIFIIFSAMKSVQE